VDDYLQEFDGVNVIFKFWNHFLVELYFSLQSFVKGE
jgi:hypothetical protein